MASSLLKSKRHVLTSLTCWLLACYCMVSAQPPAVNPALVSNHVRCACESGLVNVRCLDKSSRNCTTDNLEGKEVCEKYTSCKTCFRGLNRCLTCPPKMYGQWCEKECLCVNDGACSPNGTCICQNGFTGIHCQIVNSKIPGSNKNFQANGILRIVRQASSVQCPVLPPPDHGEIHVEFDSPKTGDAVKYTCKENFTMMGSRTRHCLPTGTWTGEAPTCEKMCPFPSTTEHVTIKINPGRLGAPLYDTFNNEVLAELEFGCDPGYNLVGPLRIRCASGTWDQEVPICRQQIDCLDPGFPKNGNRTSTVQSSGNYRIGSQLIFYCDLNHTLVGSQILTCMPSGTWNATLPLCIPNVISKCTFNCYLPWDINRSVFQLLDQSLSCTSVSDSEIQEEKNYIIINPGN